MGIHEEIISEVIKECFDRGWYSERQPDDSVKVKVSEVEEYYFIFSAANDIDRRSVIILTPNFFNTIERRLFELKSLDMGEILEWFRYVLGIENLLEKLSGLKTQKMDISRSIYSEIDALEDDGINDKIAREQYYSALAKSHSNVKFNSLNDDILYWENGSIYSCLTVPIPGFEAMEIHINIEGDVRYRVIHYFTEGLEEDGFIEGIGELELIDKVVDEFLFYSYMFHEYRNQVMLLERKIKEVKEKVEES